MISLLPSTYNSIIHAVGRTIRTLVVTKVHKGKWFYWFGVSSYFLQIVLGLSIYTEEGRRPTFNW
ncbi:MAG TPA: hypothetical protein VE130_01840 [Nitrososphaeraceae archaeon]|nr:hypothetical protein [Nitrososphaeraceae archaeon]